MFNNVLETSQQMTAWAWSASAEATEPLSFKLPCNHHYSKFFQPPARETTGGIVGFVHDFGPLIVGVAIVIAVVLYFVARKLASKVASNVLTGIAAAIIAGPLIAIGVSSVNAATGGC